jgi:hypothetical protein
MNMAIIYNNCKYCIEESIFSKIRCFSKEIAAIFTLLVCDNSFRWREERAAQVVAKSSQSLRA